MNTKKSILKKKLKQNELTIGTWITLDNTHIAEILCRAGFDWIVIDLEHSFISINKASDLIQVIDLCGCVPLVRLTSNDKNQIKLLMDAGAHGIVVPMVNSKSYAESAIAATRYGPKGVRGVGLSRAQEYGANFKNYLEWQDTEPIVIVQIENISALSNLNEIFKLKDVNGFIIGPYDLSCSMGIPGDFKNPEFIKTMNNILNAGQKYNCPAGIHIVEPNENSLIEKKNEGYKFIAYSVDIRMLDVVSRNGLNAIKCLKNE